MSKQATTEKVDVSKKQHIGTFHFEFDDAGDTIPTMIHIIPMGEWMHDAYGPIVINKQDLKEFMQNFNAKIRKGVFITAGHEGWEELPAVGWMTRLEMRENGLWAEVEWNKMGRELLSEKAYKFFSPEFYRDYEDPQTHNIYRNVLTGGALTKSPYFKELEAVVFSDKNIKKTLNDNTMNLKDILEKDITTLTDEEKAFVVEHKDELTDEQKTSHATLLPTEEAPAADPATTEPEKKEEEPKADEPVVDPVAPADVPVTASEKEKPVTMTFAEKQALETAANEGKIAMAELKKTKMDAFIGEMVFSATNKDGKFLPSVTDNLRAFAETLSDAQLASFKTIMTKTANPALFNELGAGEFAEASAIKQVQVLVEKKMAANDKLSAAEATKEVFKETEGLKARYEKELEDKANA